MVCICHEWLRLTNSAYTEILFASGVDASKSLRRTSSLIKARVTRELPGLPSLQPMHHVLSGAESILARIMCLSSKVGTVIPEEAGEAAAQSGASSAAASAAHSGGQAAAADNVQPGQPGQPAQRGVQPDQAPVGQGPHQAQRGADAHQARHEVPQQQAQQGQIPQQATPAPQQAAPAPQHGAPAPQQAVPAPQQAGHVQVPVMAPASMPVITASVTNVQVRLNLLSAHL